MKKVLRAAAGLAIIIFLLSLYVFATAGRNLIAARSALRLSVQDVDEASVIEAETHLIQASHQLRSLPARALGLVPVARQNLETLRDATDAAIPTVAAAIDLQHAVAGLEDEGLVQSKKVNVSALRHVTEPVAAQRRALDALVDQLDHGLNGWLLPPVWERLHQLQLTATGVMEGVEGAEALLARSEQMLGGDRPRTYLVLLMNNAELRGAGGVLTGVGTLHLDEGKMRLGRFRSVHDLRDKPYERVPAPAEFVRRFGVYKADTTLWLNATFSPDVPDVALVASRLYEKTAGVRTDGALLIDPRGLAALVDPDDSFRVPGADATISGSELAEFTYSDVYDRFTNQVARRAALLEVGESAFKSFITDPLVGRDRISAIAEATAGGHIRLHSFNPQEAAALEQSGLSGELQAPEDTYVVRVAQQNFGSANGEGTKLDFWTDRSVDQACSLDQEEARCHTRISLANDIPDDLPLYVAGSPYGVLRSNVEIYLPEEAELSRVESDGEVTEFRTEPQAGHQVVALYIQLEPGAATTLDVAYSLPLDDEFRLRLEPQPLATDAELDLALVAPLGWSVAGSGRTWDREVSWSRPVEVEAAPDPRSGLSAWWVRLVANM